MRGLLRKAWVAVAAWRIERSFNRPAIASTARDGSSGSFGPRDLIPHRRQVWSGGYELKDPTPQDTFRWEGGYRLEKQLDGKYLSVWKDAV